MDYCDISNQIGSYVPSSSSSNSITTKNVDCVSLETNQLTCDEITIQGEPLILDINSVKSATQNQTATSTPPETTFNGTVESTTIQTDTILTDSIFSHTTGTVFFDAPTVFNDDVTIESKLSVINEQITTGDLLAEFVQPNLSNGSSASIGIGVNDSNYGILRYNNSSLGSSSNSIEMTIPGYSGLKVSSNRVDVNSKFYNNGYEVVPRSLLSIKSFTSATTSHVYDWSTSPFSVTRVIVMLSDVMTAAPTTGKYNAPFLQVGCATSTVFYYSTNNVYRGTNIGNNQGSSIVWDNEGIRLWNALNIQEGSSTTTYPISGTIEFTYMGKFTGSQESWSIKGILTSKQSPFYYCNIAGTVYFMDSFRPVFNKLQVIKNDVNFLSGDMNVLIY